jgi:hypothetical protein
VPLVCNTLVLYNQTKRHTINAYELGILTFYCLEWRRVFAENDEINELKKISENQLVTFSNECSNIRLWDESGAQLWHLKMNEKHEFCDAIGLQQDVILMTRSQVQAVNAKNRQLRWNYQSNDKHSNFFTLFNNDKGLQLVSFQFNSSNTISTISLITLNPETGKVVSEEVSDQIVAEVSCESLKHCINLVNNRVVLLSGNNIISYDLESKKHTTKSLKSVNISTSDRILSKDNQILILKDTMENTLYKLSKDLTVEKTYKQGHIISESTALSGKVYYAELTQKNDEVRVVIMEVSSRSSIQEFSVIRPYMEHGYMKHAYLQIIKYENNTLGFNVLITFEDESMTMAKKNRPSWTREEGLASITSSEFVNLPKKISSKPRATENTFIDRIQTQVDQLKSLVPNTFRFLSSSLNPLTAKNETAVDLYEDHFGFNKLILVVTRAGKLFTLHTVSGEIVWSIFPKALVKRRSINEKVITQAHIIRQQEGGEETSIIPEIVALVNEGSVTTIIRLNGLQGSVIGAEELMASLRSAIVLPITEKLSLYHPLLIVDKEMNVHIYPEKTRMLSTLTKFNQQIYFYTSDLATSTLTGYTWSPSSQSTKAIPVWSSKFEGNITSISSNTSPQNEHIYSSVFIAGKSMLHKYLNPNLFVVSSLVEEEDGKAILHVYFVDSVTGHRVYHSIIENAREPINTVIDDNVVLCQYMNTKPKRPQVTVFEMFINDNTSSDASFIHSIASRFSTKKQQVISSFDLPTPTVLQKSYILPYPARTIAPTKTSIGVTSKEFLFALINDQILEVNKKLIDARRPREKAASGDEEGLRPYNPYIPYVPQAILTYNHTIFKVRSIQTYPTLLESTTHVWVYGLDLFYRRIAPSKPFDSLEEEFSHTLLLLTITVLIVVTFVAKIYSQKKMLAQAWS